MSQTSRPDRRRADRAAARKSPKSRPAPARKPAGTRKPASQQHRGAGFLNTLIIALLVVLVVMIVLVFFVLYRYVL